MKYGRYFIRYYRRWSRSGLPDRFKTRGSPQYHSSDDVASTGDEKFAAKLLSLANEPMPFILDRLESKRGAVVTTCKWNFTKGADKKGKNSKP